MKPSRSGFRRLRNSCDICTLSKLKCSREKPVCQRCVDRGCQQDCNYSVARRPGRRRQTSIISDESGLYDPDTGANQVRMGRGTAPLTPSSIYLDSQPENWHASTRNTHQQTNLRGGEDELLTTKSPGATMIESFTNIPIEAPHDGSTVDFESIDTLSLWEWGENEIGIDDKNVPRSGSMAQMWEIPTSQDMFSGTKFGIGMRQLMQEPSPPLSDTSQQNPSPDNRIFIQSTTKSIEDKDSSNLAASEPVSDLFKDVDCKCSSQLGQLMYLISLRHAATRPLDVVFAVEQQLKNTKDAVSACANCCLSSPYMSMMFCTSISWVIEHLEFYIRDATAGSMQRCQITSLTIGGLTLSKEMSRTCSEALVKLRLRRVVQTARELSMLNTEMKSTLLDGIRSAATETGAVAQQMFGMLEMRGAF